VLGLAGPPARFIFGAPQADSAATEATVRTLPEVGKKTERGRHAIPWQPRL